MSNDLELKNDVQGNILIISLKGRLSARNAASLRANIIKHVEEKIYQFVIQMEEIEFVDSTGLGTLVASLKIVKEKSGDIKIVGLKPNVRSIFELIRLNKLFEVYDTTEKAIESF